MKKAFLKTLSALDIQFLRIVWVDNGNVIRSKSIHRDALPGFMKSGVGLSLAQQSVPVMYDAVSPGSGLGPVGEMRLIPDWDSFNLLPYAPDSARVMGNLMRHGKPWPYCPRDFVRRIVESAKNDDLTFEIAFENEFYLLRNDVDEPVPVDDTHFASTFSMDANQEVIGTIVDALGEQGMQVVQYYAESGPGQQEISIRHTSPLEAADNQVAFRETVHAIARQHGLKASFLPKIFADKSGNGCHVHISLWRKGQNLLVDKNRPYGISEVGRAFMAGILNHLPALMAVTTPTTNSFRRIKPHFWSGAFCCWGLDNREAAIRVLTDDATGLPEHMEVKTVDATANPYLATGAILAAGLDGIHRNLDPGKPVDVDPGDLTDEESASQGIAPLPTDLGTALANFERDDVLINALGKELFQSYFAVKQAEYNFMKRFEPEQEVNLLLEMY